MGTTLNGTYVGGKRERQLKALRRLEAQLIRGNKPEFVERKGKRVQLENIVGLSESDISRINAEISSLKSKLNIV